MSSDLYAQVARNASQTALAIAPPISKLVAASTIGGRKLYLPEHQIPNTNPNGINTQTWYFQASGNFNTALANGGIQQIKIDRGTGSGKTSGKVWIRLNITNSSGAATQFVPAPFLFSNIQFQTPSGDTIQNFDPWGLWLSIVGCASMDEWESLSDLVNASNSYESNIAIPNGATVDYWVPLQGNVWSCGDIPTRCLMGDSQCYLTFAQPAATVLSGTATGVNLNSLALVFEMQQLDNSLIGALDLEYKRQYHDSYYPFMRVMNWTQTWNASSQYTLLLSGITGGVVFLGFTLRASTNGQDLYHGFPITDFQLQNAQGVAISGAQFIPETYNRWGQYPRWFLGTASQERRIYTWNFSSKDSAPVEFLMTGRVNGQYGFSGNEQLVIDTAPAATTEIQTIAFNAALASGSLYFVWITPFGSSASVSVAFNASAATLQTTIQNIIGFEGTVTVQQAFSVTGSATITFGGNYSARPLYSAGYQLLAYSTTGGSAVTSASTPGVRGITNGGTYTLTLVAFTVAIARISDDSSGGSGRMSIQNS